jgi:cytochrome c biogenesis factor
VRAVLAVRRGDRSLGTVRAGKNAYPVEQQTSNEVAIRSDLLTGEDLFVVTDEIDPGTQSVYLKVFVKPLVNLIWLAGAVFLLGAVIAFWPDPREARRLAARYAEAGARTARA